MNSEVSRKPEPQRALLGFLRFDPVTNEPGGNCPTLSRNGLPGDLLEADFETTSRLAGRKPPMRSSCPASDNFRFVRQPPRTTNHIDYGLDK